MQALLGLGRGRAAPTLKTRQLTEGVYCVEASSEKSEYDACDNILTSDNDETWNSGKRATRDNPVWVDIDLGKTYQVDHLDLLPFQVPTPANTIHRIYIGDTRSDMQLAREVAGETRHHYPISEVPVGKTGRYLRVETIESPAWVAWSSVKIFGSTP